MTITLASLLAPQTVSQIFQILLGVYQSNGFPVTSWQPFGTERTRLMAMATAIADVSGNYITAITAGGFVDYATGAWLQLLAQELYSIQYNAAVFTQGNIIAANVAGGGAVSYTSGQLIATFAQSGNRYFNVNSGTIAAGGGGGSTTTILFQAEFPGQAYNDPAGAVTLSTPLPGITITNPNQQFSAMVHVGPGTGTVSLGGSPVGSSYVIVRIDSTGDVGTATWSYSLNGGSFVSVGVPYLNVNIGGTGIQVTLNGGTNISFVKDDTFQFSSPTTWVTQQGANTETDAALATRCRNRWSTLSPIPTNGFYQLIAQSTPSVGGQVTQVIVQQDSVINNQVNIVVAGPAGALAGGTVTAIQSYINARVPITDRPVVQSPSSLAIVIGGTLVTKAALTTSATSAVQTALINYVNTVGINGQIRIASLIELAMQQIGVVDFYNLTINGVFSNLTLGSSTTFVVPQSPTFSFVAVSQ